MREKYNKNFLDLTEAEICTLRNEDMFDHIKALKDANTDNQAIHQLLVAKVEDYPNVNSLITGLETITNSEAIGMRGRWEMYIPNANWAYNKCYDELREKAAASNKTTREVFTDELFEAGCRIGKDAVVYKKVSGFFSICHAGGKYAFGDRKYIATYGEVLEKYGKADAFVEEDFFLSPTKCKDCPFQQDDEVYIIDGEINFEPVIWLIRDLSELLPESKTAGTNVHIC